VGGLAAASGADRESLRDYLAHSIVTPEATAELQGYIADSFDRFLLTLSGVPPGGEGERLLELGANPYFLTLLLKRFRRYELELANFFGPGPAAGVQVLVNAKYGERHEFRYAHFNVECDPFPYADGTFAVVLCGEILEHLVADPVFMLSEIHRVLAPQGRLVLTTPNVHRAQNLLVLLRKRNLYDPYSGYGVYGRHNREYTLGEVVDVLTRTGYRIVSASTPDTHPSVGGPARRLLRRYDPAAVVSVEKIGPNAKGITHNMAGEDVSADHARIEALFAEAEGAGIPTVAVGDRGNEIGCGLLARAARRPWSGPACACPCGGSTLCAVPADTLVIATASNWGAYGIAAGLGLVLGRRGLLHSPGTEGRMLRATLAAGARDGVTKQARPTVDGIPAAAHRALVEFLHTVAGRAR